MFVSLVKNIMLYNSHDMVTHYNQTNIKAQTLEEYFYLLAIYIFIARVPDNLAENLQIILIYFFLFLNENECCDPSSEPSQ